MSTPFPPPKSQPVPYVYAPPMYGMPPPRPPGGPNPPGAASFVFGLVGLLMYVMVAAITAVVSQRIMVEEMFSTLPGAFPPTTPSTMPATNPRAIFRSVLGGQKRATQRIRDFQLQPAVQIPMWLSVALGTVALVLCVPGLRKPNARRGLAITGLVLGCLTCLCGVGGAIYSLAQFAVG